MDSTYSSMEHWPTLKCAEVMTNAPTIAQACCLWSPGLTRTDLDGCSWHQSKLTLQHTQHLHAHLKFRVSRNTMPAVMIRLFTFHAILNDCSAAHDVQDVLHRLWELGENGSF